MTGRKHHHIQRRQWPATHGINIRNGIGSGNLPEPVWIINRWCYKINGIDHGDLRRYFIDGGIIRRLKTHEQVTIIRGLQPLECVRQVRRTYFRGSTTSPCEPGQRFFSEKAHYSLRYLSENHTGEGCIAAMTTHEVNKSVCFMASDHNHPTKCVYHLLWTVASQNLIFALHFTAMPLRPHFPSGYSLADSG